MVPVGPAHHPAFLSKCQTSKEKRKYLGSAAFARMLRIKNESSRVMLLSDGILSNFTAQKKSTALHKLSICQNKSCFLLSIY
ncbi:hypothetical protein [Xanthomonas sp. D-109]|uniref:hypothetical protein n=1 Tax=Xanthomonas sp. D-109 TaxID=2821274 RepID=UPI001ADA6328|nr:hypothetical protein [Xanthomonas sp. D-109]MBO9880984.1 hypothetical protein [Xanthomonas sp. D-109]